LREARVVYARALIEMKQFTLAAVAVKALGSTSEDEKARRELDLALARAQADADQVASALRTVNALISKASSAPTPEAAVESADGAERELEALQNVALSEEDARTAKDLGDRAKLVRLTALAHAARAKASAVDTALEPLKAELVDRLYDDAIASYDEAKKHTTRTAE